MEVRKIPLETVVWFQEGPGVRNTQYTTEGVKLLNVANLVDGELDLSTSSRFISTEEAYGKYRHFLVDEGDFIIASSGIKVEYFEKKMGFVKKQQLPLCMNTSTIRFKILNPAEYDIRYFMYFLKSNAFKNQLSRQITGSAQLNFGPSHLKKMSVPATPIGEQRNIAAILDKITSIIKLNKKIISLLDQLVKSQFIEMFGAKSAESCTNRIADYANVMGGYAFKSEEFCKDAIPVIRISNIANGLVYLDRDVCYTKQFWEDNPRYRVLDKDILVAMSGATTGKSGMYRGRDPALLNQRVACVRVKEGNYSAYIFAALQLEWMYDLIQEKSAGCAQPNISGKQIEDLPMPFATLGQQEEFARFVEQTDKSKIPYETEVAA